MQRLLHGIRLRSGQLWLVLPRRGTAIVDRRETHEMFKNNRILSVNTYVRGSLAMTAALGALSCSQVEPPSSQTGSDELVELGTAKLALTAPVGGGCSSDPRVTTGMVTLRECRGANRFFRGKFGGNGRSCGTCHRVEDNFTISPEFIGALPPRDRLFVAEQQFALTTLERPAMLRTLGLIVENVDGTDDLENKFTLRSIPHTLSMSTSINSGRTEPPLDATGWSGDGAPGDGTLRDFLTGAVVQHYPKDLSRTDGVSFNLPGNAALNQVEAFQLGLGRTNELDINTVTVNDNRASDGIGVFLANRCNGCHSNAGANIGPGINLNFDTGVERLTPGANLIPRDGGFGGQGEVNFNFDASGNGILDSFGTGKFNTPPLIEAADTGPFFHNNSARTIEDAIAFYNTSEFNNSPAGVAGAPIDMTGAEVIDMGRFLRVLNASFNASMALQRLEAAETLMLQFGNAEIPVEDELIELAVYEIEDAKQVLERAPGGRLSQSAQRKLARALVRCAIGQTRTNATGRLSAIEQAIALVGDARTDLGSGMNFTLGNANLLR